MSVRTIIFILILNLLLANPIFAEVFCKAPVFYNWEKEILVGKNQSKKILPGKSKVDIQSKEKYTVYWGIISSKGDNEESAKKNLDNVLLEKQGDVIAKCQEDHEGLSRCIAGSYASLKEVLSTSTFKAREELENSIKQDCENKSGHCLNIEKKEPVCEEVKKAKLNAGKSKKKGK